VKKSFKLISNGKNYLKFNISQAFWSKIYKITSHESFFKQYQKLAPISLKFMILILLNFSPKIVQYSITLGS